VSRTYAVPRREPGAARVSLRSELLFQLACLAAAAVLLALWTVFVVQHPFFERFGVLWLFALVAIDLLVFVLLGRFLLERFVMRPLGATADAAAKIADGDFELRVPAGQTREIDAVAEAVNRLTDQLLQNQFRLAENVKSLDETNRLLVDAQRDLVQVEKLAAIGKLAAGIAHEVGNPLGAILGYAGVLRRRGAATEVVDGIERETGRIDAIVRGLLDYARPAARERVLVDINESIAAAVQLLRRRGRLERIEVRFDLRPDLSPVEASPQALEQVWVNLLDNAEAAMEGCGTVHISTRELELELDTPVEPARRADDPPGIDYSHLRRMRSQSETHNSRLRPGARIVRVTVRDTGPGITADHARYVFDPFFTTKGPGKGSGLGLAIVASTIADIGGHIELGTPCDGGATFVLSLPIALESS
jgi:two-component system, NtrC family, sensor kinase